MVPSRRTQQNWLPAFFNDFFDDDFRHFGNMMRTSSPAINVKESDKEYTVEIAAPGMSKDDFKIRINEENELVVTLEHKDEKKEEKKDEKYLRREFSYSHFEQTLLLPDDIKKEEISASMEHGHPAQDDGSSRNSQRKIHRHQIACGLNDNTTSRTSDNTGARLFRSISRNSMPLLYMKQITAPPSRPRPDGSRPPLSGLYRLPRAGRR